MDVEKWRDGHIHIAVREGQGLISTEEGHQSHGVHEELPMRKIDALGIPRGTRGVKQGSPGVFVKILEFIRVAFGSE